MGDSAFVRVPASIGNLGSGLDVLGMAVDLWNDLRMERDPSGNGVRVEIRGEGLAAGCEEVLPRDESHASAVAAARVFRRLGRRQGFLRIFQVNRIPLKRGLGSSAAARLAGAFAANRLCGSPLSPEELAAIAADLEGHPDNAAAAALGGIAAAVSNGRALHCLRWSPPAGLACALAVPEFELSTSRARAALPSRVPMRDAVFNLGRVLLWSASSGRRSAAQAGRLLALACEDRLHQPYRRSLVPGFFSVLGAATRAGAWGAVLSGAGPTVAAFCPSSRAKPVARAMVRAFRRHGVKATPLVLRPSPKGATAR